LQVRRSHARPEGTISFELKEPGFGERWDLGRIVHIDDQVTAAMAFHVRKVGRFGLDRFQDFPHLFRGRTLFDGLVECLVRNSDGHHKSHVYAPCLKRRTTSRVPLQSVIEAEELPMRKLTLSIFCILAITTSLCKAEISQPIAWQKWS